MSKYDEFKIEEEEIKIREQYLDQELKAIDQILAKYMSEEDAIKITFHLLNLLRAMIR